MRPVGPGQCPDHQGLGHQGQVEPHRDALDTADDGGEDAEDRRRVVARAALETSTEREREVAVALGRGLSNLAGRELYLSVATVKAHVGRILTKLALDNRAQVAILVHDAGVDEQRGG